MMNNNKIISKANELIHGAKESISILHWDIGQNIQRNIQGCDTATYIVEQLQKDLYFWQWRKRIFWYRVIVEIWRVKEELTYKLSKINE